MLQALIDGIETKPDLITEIWTRRHTVVTENSYYQLVALLRKSFSSIDLPETIITRPRRGGALVRPQPQNDMGEAGVPFDAGSTPEGNMPDASGDCLVPSPRQAKPDRPLRGHRLASPLEASLALVRTALRAGPILIAAGTGVRALVTATLAAVVTAPPRLSASAPLASHGLPAAAGHSLQVGDSLISYSQTPADTALRVWRDVQARVTLTPEQTRRIYIAEHPNRYAVLACSEPLDPLTIRCTTVTISV